MTLHAGAQKPAIWAATTGRVQPAGEGASLETPLRRAAVINAALLKLSALELSDLDTESYRACIGDAIAGLERAMTPSAVRAVEQQLAEDVHDHLRAREDLLNAREAEFSATVALLTDAVIQFRDTNADFTAQVLDHSDRMGRLVSVEDLRTLRARLAQEVAGLRDAALAKQEADARQIATLSAKVESLEARLAVTAAQANRDALTGLANRTAWDQRMEQLAVQLANDDQPFALAMIDLDRFKLINDTYGHSAGDSALFECAELCRQAFGSDDFVARFGGDEIAVLIAAPTLDHAVEHITRLINSVRRANAHGAGTERAPFTISVGLARAVEHDTVQSLINRADKALYAAKQAGRDRLVVSSTQPPAPLKVPGRPGQACGDPPPNPG